MVRITVEIIRKKLEPNVQICTLEELSLNQERIEKIEHIQHWCPGLKILHLQDNILFRIENLHKLERLQYLDLANNFIQVVENLEQCARLEKLDLTHNFIAHLESICRIKMNLHLRELSLAGNACADIQGYRHYLISELPQLRSIDGIDITREERLKVRKIRNDQVLKAQAKYLFLNDDPIITRAHQYVFWRQIQCPTRLEMYRRSTAYYWNFIISEVQEE